MDIIPLSVNSHDINSANLFFAPCDAVYGLLKIADAFNFLVSENAASSAEIVFCVDESR